MLNLKDVENKKELFQNFFTWLFDDKRIINNNVSLVNEIDLSLCSNYIDSNIYYPNQFKDFFETPAMQKLGRVSQLGLAINNYTNLYHSRLEHSKGTYYRKLEELFYNYQQPEWKKYIEQNNLKLHLIAELLKIAGHDIGHPPLSHAFEEQILMYRGAHEDIGKRIMLENPDILAIYNTISPDLPSIMEDLYNKNFLNFKQHDESNYDVDRIDYLIRDNFYLGYDNKLSTQMYQTVSILTDETGKPKMNSDASIYESENGNSFIDVYDFESLAEIEKTLLLRKKSYENIYLSPATHIYESCIECLFDAFLECNSQTGIHLKNILQNMKGKKPDEINLNEYIAFDEISLYSELLDVAENHEDHNVRDLATMIIPNMNSFLNLIYSHLSIYNKNTNYNEYEKKFLKKLKRIISSDSNLSVNLCNKNFTLLNTIILSDECSSKLEIPIIHQKSKIKAYKKDNPIYIRDEIGRIFELSHHPNKNYNWENECSILKLDFAFIPYLRFKGVSESLINNLKVHYPCADQVINNYKILANVNHNLAPLKLHNKIEDKILDL